LDTKLLVIYISRIYCALTSVVFLPVMIVMLGKESYGLVGVFVLLQGVLGVLDAGIGSSLARECVLCKNSRNNFLHFLNIFKKILWLYIAIAILVLVTGGYLSRYLAYDWIITTLDRHLVQQIMIIMFLIFTSRFIQSPFRSLLLGNEKHIFLSYLDMLTATIGSPLIVAIFYFTTPDILLYFYIQLIASVLRLLILVASSKMLITKLLQTLKNTNDKYQTSLKKLVYFSAQISALSVVWIISSQADKVALTKFMPLDEYATYSVALSLLALTTIISAPLNQYLLPRLTSLYNNNNLSQYNKLLEDSLTYLLIVIMPLIYFMFYHSAELVYSWSGDISLSSEVSVFLKWLFAGSCLHIITNIAYIVLYTQGRLKQHTYVNIGFASITVPLSIAVAYWYSGLGTSILYFSLSLLYLCTWCLYVFHANFKNLLVFLGGKIAVFSAISFVFFSLFNEIYSSNRMLLFIELAGKGIFLVIVCLCIDKVLLNKMLSKIETRQTLPAKITF
jgi:O-antigen/teichoic acid export membrane protein